MTERRAPNYGVMTAYQALQALCEEYAADFGECGYDKRDMIDYVVAQTLQSDLEVHSQKEGIGAPALAAWYEARAAYLRRNCGQFAEAGVEVGSPTEEQRERRGKIR